MIKEKIRNGKTYLGIELGSTRIKSCLITDTYSSIASASYEWENKFIDGYWTYDIDEIHRGIVECYSSLRADVFKKYGIEFKKTGALGISGMMHGYLAFDENMNLLVPFRTWRNTTTEQAAAELSTLFNYNVPQRWSIAHLYQAILNNEEHVYKITHITTLSGYVHYLLTGKHELGICEASGMFPVSDGNYDTEMLDKFRFLIKNKDFSWDIENILPKIKPCWCSETLLTKEGVAFLDKTNSLESDVPVCPPEGDAGTGMVATNSIMPKTGNISAGTSVFAMLVLEKPLSRMYPEVDVIMTPSASPVAMIHSNNGCSELDAWVNVFEEFTKLSGFSISKDKLYKTLYENALFGDKDCGEIISYNYLASEPVTGVKRGRPTIFRTTHSNFNLANFFRSQLYASVIPLKLGLDMLKEKENVSTDEFTAQGGLFKVKGVAQQLLANTLNTSISTSTTASEGGAWGMALLAAYSLTGSSHPLGEWLDKEVFKNIETLVFKPETDNSGSFDKYISLYKSGLSIFNTF